MKVPLKPTRPTSRRKWWEWVRGLSDVSDPRSLQLVGLIIVLSVFMVTTAPELFPTANNIKAIMLDAALFSILATGMMLLLIAGEFDLSIGSTLALSGVVTALLVKDMGVPALLGFLIGIGVGALAGLVNGVLVTKLRINSLIVTLATLGIFRGVTQLVSRSGITSIGHGFRVFGQSKILGLQSPIWVMFIVVVVAWIAVSRTRFFRRYYYVGGNRMAAARSGVKVGRLILIGFMIMGALAGLAGVVLASRLNGAFVSAGIGVELRVITAVVLGGASLKGGVGTIPGAFLGVVFISLVQNALILSKVQVFWQSIVVGVVLLAAVAVDKRSRTEV